MLVGIYLSLMFLGIIFLISGIVWGTSKKVGPAVSCILLSAIFFMFVSLNSMSITKDYCLNQVTNSSVEDNQTSYTNNIECRTQRESHQGMSALFSGLVIFNIFLLIFYVLDYYKSI